MSPLVISLIAFFAVVSLVAAIGMLIRDFGGKKAESRLHVITGVKPGEAETKGILRQVVFKEGVTGLLGGISRLVQKFGSLSRLFEQSDTNLTFNTFFLISGGCAVVGVLISIVAFCPPPMYPVVAIVCGSLPYVWLMFRRSQRMGKFAKQLPDALELISRALRSGHGLASAIKVVSDEMSAPLATEFGRVYEAQNLNVPIDVALKEMYRRVPNLDFKFFVTAVTIQRQSGGDLAEILDKIGHIVRDRFRILGQVQALTGEGRISGIVLMALPIVLFFAVYYLNAEYVMVLFTDPLGRKMIGVAIFLQLLGAITIKKIISIKV